MAEVKDERFDTKAEAALSTSTVTDDSEGVTVSGELTTDPDTVTYTNTRKTGNLVIEKKVVSEVAADAEAVYTFRIKLSEAVTATYKAVDEAAGTTEYIDFTEGRATITVTGAGVKRIEGLPAGAHYTVEEDAVESMATTSKAQRASFRRLRQPHQAALKMRVKRIRQPHLTAVKMRVMRMRQLRQQRKLPSPIPAREVN